MTSCSACSHAVGAALFFFFFFAAACWLVASPNAGAAGPAAACDAAPPWLAESERLVALAANFFGLMVTLLVELCVL